MSVEISFLADHPDHVTELGSWLHAEWGWFTPGSTLESRLAKLRDHLNRDELPLAVIAHANGVLLGTAALRARDMDTRAELTPWLASVYVTPAARERGVGARLVARIEAEARRLGFRIIHLVTFDKASYYAKRGWQELERAEYRDEPVVVMSKALAAAEAPGASAPVPPNGAGASEGGLRV
jgi:N-acetylglutamate synthase-like GNAT family acetyltransferase